MSQLDTLLAGGTLITPAGRVRADVGVVEGRIAVLAEPGRGPSARQTIDAGGLWVLPGIVDAHVHFREPGPVHKEGFASGSPAAAAGGVTTVMVMPTDDPLTLTAEDFKAKAELARGQSVVDFALQAAVVRDLSHIEPLVQAGAVSFEMFLGDAPASLLMPDSRVLYEALLRIRAAGAVAGVTPADDGIVQAATAAIPEAEAASPLAFARSRPPLSEALAVARAVTIACSTGTRLHVRQVSCREALRLVEAARRHHPGLSAEVMPHNLLLDETELERQGPFAKVAPPLRHADEQPALWQALRAGVIDIVATDHAPHLPEEKEAGREDLRKAPGGFPGVQTVLPLMLDAAARGLIAPEQVVRVLAEAPARLFGLFPRKGALLPGGDADLVLIDPARQATIRNEDQLSRARITPFAGREVRGWPVLTMLRGRVIMRDGAVDPDPHGRLVTPSRG